MRFYNIKDEYVHFLKQYDNTVANNKDESRPYNSVPTKNHQPVLQFTIT